VQRVELFAAVRTEGARQAEIVAALARAFLDPIGGHGTGMPLDDAEHDAAKVVAAPAHDLEGEIAGKLEKRVGHARIVGTNPGRTRVAGERSLIDGPRRTFPPRIPVRFPVRFPGR